MKQPKPDSMKYTELIDGISKGIIKIPKFQREFVWDMDETARLLDSILKGYPIGTFILWQTTERMNSIKNIGNLQKLPDTPDGKDVQYVLDGQQRITSLYAAHEGARIKRADVKKESDYGKIYVNLGDNPTEIDDNIIIAQKPESGKYLSLCEVLNFDFDKGKELEEKFTSDEINKVNEYWKAFQTYDFSTVTLKKEDVDSAIEVFTRINTGGKTLTLFEIMAAKTYSESKDFDMRKKWDTFVDSIRDSQYEGISSAIILNLLSLLISPSRDCKRKTILKLDRDSIIERWSDATSALKESIDYFRSTYRIPVSRLLPYDSLLVPFAYFFHHNNYDKPSPEQKKFLEEFFWRISLSYRYSSATESKLAQDIKRIDNILNGARPEYNPEIKVYLDEEDLIETNFSAGDSYCKAVLCLLAYQKPTDFQDGADVILDNAWLQKANSKNYHHFFPKAYLKNADRSNSIVNITLVSDRLNKKKIGSKPPSKYIGDFKKLNKNINDSLKTHLINLDGFGIENDDYDAFLQARAKWIREELKSRIDY